MASKLINDLSSVPGIVGALGLSIAEAQKEFNADYLRNVQALLAMAKTLVNGLPDNATPEQKEKAARFSGLFQDLLAACAPPRYQYTETTLTVKMDLAQALDVAGSMSIGAAFGAIVVNAGLTVGYGYDYRAAAECRTVIQARPSTPNFDKDILTRAKELSDDVLKLPDRTAVDDKVFQHLRTIFENTVGVPPKQLVPPVAAPAPGTT
jgi:hypothetical protein